MPRRLGPPAPLPALDKLLSGNGVLVGTALSNPSIEILGRRIHLLAQRLLGGCVIVGLGLPQASGNASRVLEGP